MKKANLMIVGTSSGAGKSLFVTALCRIFNKDKYKVSPFKSQNMALNSYITKDGKEMGRAQVVQAEASCLEPDVNMNPILLKPSTMNKIQIIVCGKSIGNMSGVEYNQYKKNLIPILKETYSKIESENDIVVIEGAGSPAEINMKEEDISNFAMARIADAPVILVADIDRGGVFASIYGTIMLLKEEDRKRIKGIVINKFRGNKEVLKAGFEIIENLTGVKTLGVIPYADIDIEDEDSLSEKYKSFKLNKNSNKIKISVIKLKHISNVTDIDALSIYDDVEIQFVSERSQIGNEDLLIIPGSKNTIDDLKWLKESGIAEEIIKRARTETIIFGICGGFQILGNKVKDPYHIEGDIEELNALDNLKLWYDKEELKKEISSGVISLLGVDEFLKKPVSALSMGMKKRLSIACAVASKPKILLMDEPSAYLDIICKADIHRYISEHKRQGGSIILVSHDVGDFTVCDEHYVLKSGVLSPFEYKDNVDELIKKL